MANFPEEPIWQDVYEIDNNDLVLGRKNSNTLGASNIPLQQLVNRDAYLKEEIRKKPAIPLWDDTQADYLANIDFVHYSPYTGSSPHIYMCIQDTTVAGFPPSEDGTHWVDLTPNAGVLMAPIGMIQAMPFRADNLPLGWIPCDGTKYPLTSWVGGRLANLPAQFRVDHRITIDNTQQTVNAPDKITPPIAGENKYGRFIRYGASEHVGTHGNDAIRNITGKMEGIHNIYIYEGAFYSAPPDRLAISSNTRGGQHSIVFDASRVVPTDTENVPCYEVALPCIYLGTPDAEEIVHYIRNRGTK